MKNCVCRLTSYFNFFSMQKKAFLSAQRGKAHAKKEHEKNYLFNLNKVIATVKSIHALNPDFLPLNKTSFDFNRTTQDAEQHALKRKYLP